MDAISHLKSRFHQIRKSRNFRIFFNYGGPMFIFVIGGSFLMEEFQKVRLDHIKSKHNQELMNQILKDKKLDKVDIRTEYEKIRNIDTSNYRNIRGPRVYEDNTEFLKNRELQEKRLVEILEQTSKMSSSVASQ